MKKIYTLCFFLLALLNIAAAQEWKLNYGVSAGATSSTYLLENISSGVGRSASKTYNGQVSGWAMISPNKYVGVEGGLAITGLGAVLNQSEFGSRQVRQHTYWLQVPVNLVAKLPLRDTSNFFLKVGGYAGIGLFGKNYIPDSYSGSAKQGFSFGDGGTQKGVDFGWNVSFGYKFRSGYLINLGYQRGLTDLAPSQAAYEQRNRAYTVGIGYEF